MKVAPSIPGEPRSRLYATALAEYLAKHRGRKVTDRLDTIYGVEESRVEPGVRRLQRRSLERDSW